MGTTEHSLDGRPPAQEHLVFAALVVAGPPEGPDHEPGGFEDPYPGDLGEQPFPVAVVHGLDVRAIAEQKAVVHFVDVVVGVRIPLPLETAPGALPAVGFA